MSKRSSLLLVALSCGLLAPACRVSDPTAEQVIPWNYVADRVPTQVDVAYGPGAVHRLDVYPAQGTPSGVALVFLHSGGWSSGDKDAARVHLIPQWLMDRGHVVFSANYTLTANGTSAFPTNVDDVKRAIAWANNPARKAQYGYQKVIVVGTSAGGHLALLATTSGHAVPDGLTAAAIRPDAAMSFSGPLNMLTWGAQGTQEQRDVQLAFFQGFWGNSVASPDQVPELARVAASPHAFVDANDPSVFVSSSDTDPLALAAHNANVLEQAYIDVGANARAWNDIVEGDGHNLAFTNIAAAQLFITKVAAGEL